jgi:hypothetical protein
MSEIKGMVQIGALTYRIVKMRRGMYDAIRILDDVCIGTFRTVPRLSVQATGADDALLRAVATAAMRQAKTSWLRLAAVTPDVVAAAMVTTRKAIPA